MYNMSKNLAVILARGGSKRVPQKNLKMFCGLPMVAWPVRAAVQSGLFESVVISTDDEKIRDVAIAYGASAPFKRPAELSGDGVPSRAAEIHAIKEMSRTNGEYSAVCSLTGTSAFIGTEELRTGFSALCSGNWEFAISVLEYPHPPQRALRVASDHSLEMASPEYAGTRTQDLQARYHDAGQFYWGRPQAFLGGRSSLASRTIAVVLPRSRAVDIDTPDDWIIAEAVKRSLAQFSPLE
jgi:pseudaminic acid cytidylyltransferase